MRPLLRAPLATREEAPNPVGLCRVRVEERQCLRGKCHPNRHNHGLGIMPGPQFADGGAGLRGGLRPAEN